MDERDLAGMRAQATELGQVAVVLAAAGHDPASTRVADGDRLLLALHRELTGQDLELALACPACATVSAVRLGPDTVPAVRPRSAVLGVRGGLRQPTYADLAGLPADGTGDAVLLRRCVVGDPAREPSAADFVLIDDSLVGPLVFACAGCGADVEEPIDLQSLLLRALLRVLDGLDAEVHLLASAYGWDLATIEALPRERRRRFAALIADGAGR
ncbi:hypothetical protein [Actinomadura sp. 6N118]|uniref:hypothetical protein n=1 Tax=Actinomadura sp. 6N118 TaxID=3375151 RepID=UPI0037A2B2F7